MISQSCWSEIQAAQLGPLLSISENQGAGQLGGGRSQLSFLCCPTPQAFQSDPLYPMGMISTFSAVFFNHGIDINNEHNRSICFLSLI